MEQAEFVEKLYRETEGGNGVKGWRDGVVRRKLTIEGMTWREEGSSVAKQHPRLREGVETSRTKAEQQASYSRAQPA